MSHASKTKQFKNFRKTRVMTTFRRINTLERNNLGHIILEVSLVVSGVAGGYTIHQSTQWKTWFVFFPGRIVASELQQNRINKRAGDSINNK